MPDAQVPLEPSQVTVLAKPWYESKVIWVNAVGAIALALGITLDAANQLLVPSVALAWLGLGLLGLNGLLRFLTRQPLGSLPGETAEVPGPLVPSPPLEPPTASEWTKPE